MSDLHKNDQDSPYADDMEFVRYYARRNDGYSIVQPVVDFINRHLAPPRIIRTVEELEALDPVTELLGPGLSPRTASNAQSVCHWWGADEVLPAVVVRDGADVRADIRAARKALEES